MPDDPYMLRRVAGVLSALLLVAVTGCTRPQASSHAIVVGSETGMLYVARTTSDEIALSASTIQKTMTDTLRLLDDQNPNSEVAKINRVGDSVRLPVSRSVLRALDLARHYSEITGGAFDITTGRLAALWDQGLLDDDTTRVLTLSHIGMKHLEISETGTIAMTMPGLVLTPGRFAFAYALDQAIVERRKSQASPCLMVWSDLARRDGVMPKDQSPLVPIVAPGIRNQSNIGTIDLSGHASLAIVQSSLTPPLSPVVIDPRNGFPASSNRIVAVIGPLAVKAYALAQALFILGLEDGRPLLDAFPEYEAMLMPDKRRVTLWMTRGFEASFTPAPYYRGKAELWENPRSPVAPSIEP